MTILTRESPPEDVISFIDTLTMPAGTIAEVVGVWVWLLFIDKPNQVLRDLLKLNSFKWIRKRQKWAHCGGKPTRRGQGDPRMKYATARITVAEDD